MDKIQVTIHCPNYWPYSQHWFEVLEETLLGSEFYSELAEENDDADFMEMAIGDALDEVIVGGNLDIPEGWHIDGWESHAHKDNNGVVTVYFASDNLCADCGEE